MLEQIKKRCYITSELFNDEITSLISAAIIDCVESGIDESIFNEDDAGNYDAQALNCITAFVKANRGNDRSDTQMYLKMYETYRNKMTLESNYNGSDTNE